jgi:hypothetical protein
MFLRAGHSYTFIAALKRCATQRRDLRGAEAPLFHVTAGMGHPSTRFACSR